MSGSGKDVSGVVGISRDEVRAGTFPDNSTLAIAWLRDFIEQTHLSTDEHCLLLLDGHILHYSKAFIDMAINN